MSAIINIGNVQPPSPIAPGLLAPSTHSVTSSGAAQADTVEFSALGQALSRATELSSFSVARIRAIRASIDDGTFETPERINGTATRLLKHLERSS